MKIIFMGTPDFAVGTLEALHEAGHEVRLWSVSRINPKDVAMNANSGESSSRTFGTAGISAGKSTGSDRSSGTDRS